MKKILVSICICFVLGACSNTSQSTSDQKNITSLGWELINNSGNATVSPPWKTTSLTVKSDGTISHSTITSGGSENENGAVTDWSAELEGDDLSDLTTLINDSDVKNQQNINLVPDCVGGGFISFTYKENGTAVNSFNILSGCDADLKTSYPKLDELVTKLSSLDEKYKP